MASQESISRPADSSTLGRIASIGIGGLLVSGALRRRSGLSLVGGLAGADLIYHGVTGEWGAYRALNAIATKAAPEPAEIERSITIAKTPEELYESWRTPANLSRVMGHFAEITPTGDGKLHWKVRGPLNRTFEWDSRQVEAEPGRKLCWETVGNSNANHGCVIFRKAPDGFGGEVTLRIELESPIARLGARLGSAGYRIPHSIAGKALRRFKSLVETGEIPTLEHNPSARGSSDRF